MGYFLDGDVTRSSCYPSGYKDLQRDSKLWYSPGVLTTGVQGAISFENSFTNTEPTTTAYAAAISVAWQESDLSLFMPKSAPVLALQRAGVTLPPDPYTESRTTSESAISTSNTQDQDGDTESGGGLSTGAIAGIGVGAAIVGMMFIGLLWWAAKRFKVSRRNRNISEAGEVPVQQVYKVPDVVTRPDEVGGTPRTELPG
ncbi:hypothetical protein ACHAPO_010569 [Fusarium lateritium]